MTYPAAGGDETTPAVPVPFVLSDHDNNRELYKAVNREDKRSRRYRDRQFAKFERSRRYRDR